jgi:uridine phosphorylase
LKRSGVIVDVQHPAKRPKTASGPSEPVKSGTIRVTRASTRANGEPSARTTRASTARAASSSTRVTRALTRANAACTTRASTSCAASSGSRNSRRQAG